MIFPGWAQEYLLWLDFSKLCVTYAKKLKVRRQVLYRESIPSCDPTKTRSWPLWACFWEICLYRDRVMLLDSVPIQTDFRKTFCGGRTTCQKLRDIGSKQRHRVFSASQQAGFDQESPDNPAWKLMWRVITLPNIANILNCIDKKYSQISLTFYFEASFLILTDSGELQLNLNTFMQKSRHPSVISLQKRLELSYIGGATPA